MLPKKYVLFISVNVNNGIFGISWVKSTISRTPQDNVLARNFNIAMVERILQVKTTCYRSYRTGELHYAIYMCNNTKQKQPQNNKQTKQKKTYFWWFKWVIWWKLNR